MKILLICRSSRPQVFYKVGIFKNVAKFSGKHQHRSLFNEVVGRSPQTYYLFKKRLRHRCNLQNFEGGLNYRTTVDDRFWIYQNNNCQTVLVLELIINKSYKEAGRRGRSKLLLPTHINHQRCTLVKKFLLREGIFAKNCEDLWGFFCFCKFCLSEFRSVSH